jgi:hypothetical protein
MTDRSEEPDITEAGRSAVSDDRFNWLEYPNDDFPYYNGRPVRISGPQWWFVMLMTAIGFLALVAPIPFIPGAIGQFIRAILFFAIPLAGLAIVTLGHWTAIFRPIGGRDIKWIIGFAVLNILGSVAIGSAVLRLFGATANPLVSGLGSQSTSEQVLFFLKTALQLFAD